jgi:hypothetical protein
MRRLKKKIFLGLFGGTVLLLGGVRLCFPGVTGAPVADETPAEASADATARKVDSHSKESRFLQQGKPDATARKNERHARGWLGPRVALVGGSCRSS